MGERQLYWLLYWTNKIKSLRKRWLMNQEAYNFITLIECRSKCVCDVPWSPGSDCPVLRYQRRFLVGLSPPSSLSLRDQCHPSEPQSQHEPVCDVRKQNHQQFSNNWAQTVIKKIRIWWSIALWLSRTEQPGSSRSLSTKDRMLT